MMPHMTKHPLPRRMRALLCTPHMRNHNELATTPPMPPRTGERQYGAGRRGGASQEIGEVRAAAHLNPDQCLASFDLRNAFGSVRWADALRAVAPPGAVESMHIKMQEKSAKAKQYLKQ